MLFGFWLGANHLFIPASRTNEHIYLKEDILAVDYFVVPFGDILHTILSVAEKKHKHRRLLPLLNFVTHKIQLKAFAFFVIFNSKRM